MYSKYGASRTKTAWSSEIDLGYDSKKKLLTEFITETPASRNHSPVASINIGILMEIHSKQIQTKEQRKKIAQQTRGMLLINKNYSAKC